MAESPPVPTVIAVEGELRACPECDYDNGFHVSFVGPGSDGKLTVLLICPNCSARFDLGWHIVANAGQ